MPDLLEYLSPQWRDEAEKQLKEKLSPEKMNFTTSSMSNIYKDCPNGVEKFMFYKFEKGELAELIVGEGEPPKAEFKIIGTYDVFAQISRAELGAQKALMTRKLKLKGNMIKALKLAAVADRLNRILATIPTKF
ncbi:SCP2 sterol-binding domain-containing protein [bacterium]|nr:SCP2 sterol-binding domain-containing protein [bacterium]